MSVTRSYSVFHFIDLGFIASTACPTTFSSSFCEFSNPSGKMLWNNEISEYVIVPQSD